ncbi:Monooxygenase, FAD-binding [Sphingomonas paucimobilis]|nr:Monooxygenase, FAD-binding [Sphingomonas paucimobilis]
MSERRTLVIGAGISGLTAAAALGQRGWDVLVIERRGEVADHGGIGLTMVGNAMQALDRIGVARQCVDAGVPMDKVAICRPDGAHLLDDPMQPLGGGAWPAGTGMTRSDVHDILRRAAEKVAVIRCSTTVEAMRNAGDGVEVTFDNGSTGRFELVVAADGIYSQTRQWLMPQVKPQPTGQAVWRAEVPRPAGLYTTHLYPGGPPGFVGICPISRDRAYLYIVQDMSGEPREPSTLHLQMRAELEGYGGLVAEAVQNLNSPEQVNYRPLEWLLAPRPWGQGRIVMIGDAAHANPPTLAQGAAMGIEDAVVLAEELDATPGSIGDALARFTDRRYPRARDVVEISCRLSRWQVEKAHNADVIGEISRSHALLCEPA